jgi:hypothetical protein
VILCVSGVDNEVPAAPDDLQKVQPKLPPNSRISAELHGRPRT